MGNYVTALNSRNTVPFSALTVWYLPGLDHLAHGNGMGVYTDHFKTVTDKYIKAMVADLKTLDEFDNKIFIIVADHGHTAMPTNLTYERTLTYMNDMGSHDVTDYPFAEMSCKLKLNFRNSDDPNMAMEAVEAELNNNNLHIWELGEVMKAIGENGWGQYKVLTPKEIAILYKDKKQKELPFGPTETLAKANVIAALNGPMAQVYLRGVEGWQDKNVDIVELAKLAGRLKTYLMESGVDLRKEDKNLFKNLLLSVDTILIRQDGVYKIFKGVLTDVTGDIIGSDAVSINENTFDSGEYITAVTRIKGLNIPDRSGDLILIFKDSTNDAEIHRFTSGVACKSWHGSLNTSDSYVPLIVAYPGGNKYELESIINKDTVCPLGACVGNWKVTDIILETVKK
jgi:hypothetical protein